MEANYELMKFLDDKELHRLMHKVVEILLSCSTQDPEDYSRPYLRYKEEEEPDAGGLVGNPILTFTKGYPASICGPWGSWYCLDTDRSGKDSFYEKDEDITPTYEWMPVISELTMRLGLAFDYYNDDADDQTVYYFILKADDEPLPWCSRLTKQLEELMRNSYSVKGNTISPLRESWKYHEANRAKELK